MIIMSESPCVSSVRERGLWLERIEVIPDTGVTVQRTAKRRNKRFEILQRQCANVRLRSHRSQLDKLPPPLRKAFAEEAVVYSALLDHSTGFEFHFPYRGLTLPARAFVEKAARVDEALSQSLRIVRILRDDLEFADR